jgi:hypothetical protein
VLPEVPRELATHHGWVASVYLDVSRNHAGAPHEVRLRWEALAEELREQDADDKTVDSAGEAATQSHAQPGAGGRAVFAGIRYTKPAPVAPRATAFSNRTGPGRRCATAGRAARAR